MLVSTLAIGAEGESAAAIHAFSADFGTLSPSVGAGTAKFAVYGRGDPGRARIERFIRVVYARQYGAEIEEFAPVLVARETSGRVVAAAGYRHADGPLFLEKYLEAPIERLLPTPARVIRERVTEVGHLASVQAGEGYRLVVALAAHLAALGTEWVASTVTSELRHVVGRLALGAVSLAQARPESLGLAAASWGSYYEHHPVVMAGHLPSALRRLEHRRVRSR